MFLKEPKPVLKTRSQHATEIQGQPSALSHLNTKKENLNIKIKSFLLNGSSLSPSVGSRSCEAPATASGCLSPAILFAHTENVFTKH